MAASSAIAAGAASKVSEAGDFAMEVEEPSDYGEQSKVADQIAKFEADKAVGEVIKAQDMPMLVAVRVRPLWDKEVEAAS
jgi:hypothetical protein